MQGALAWIWARSPVAIPIPGFRTVAQIEENAGAMAGGPLDPAPWPPSTRRWDGSQNVMV